MLRNNSETDIILCNIMGQGRFCIMTSLEGTFERKPFIQLMRLWADSSYIGGFRYQT